MKFAESSTNKVSGEMGIWQNLKRCWCQDEREEDQSANPGDQR